MSSRSGEAGCKLLYSVYFVCFTLLWDSIDWCRKTEPGVSPFVNDKCLSARRYASTVLAMSLCPSDSLSATRRYCIATDDRIEELVFRTVL